MRCYGLTKRVILMVFLVFLEFLNREWLAGNMMHFSAQFLNSIMNWGQYYDERLGKENEPLCTVQSVDQPTHLIGYWRTSVKF